MNKNILITGCSSGLGEALAQFYLENGYTVYGISRSKPTISHTNFYFKSFDLAKINEIKKDLTTFINEIASIEVAYLNAGTLGPIKQMTNLSLNEIHLTLELNVYANKELLDILATQEVKHVIATSSGAAVNGSKGWGAYSLSKASLNMLINLYAKEMPHTKLLAVAPGVIETPMTNYIRYEVDDTIFTSAKILKEGEIQTPAIAAERLHQVIVKSKNFESGSFIDVRNID